MLSDSDLSEDYDNDPYFISFDDSLRLKPLKVSAENKGGDTLLGAAAADIGQEE